MLQCVSNWKIPNSKKSLSSFLGFAGCYREFIQNYAVIVEPLQKMKRKGAEFEWGNEQQAAFEQIRTKLMEYPVLALPTPDGQFVLDTDASDVAIAGNIAPMAGLSRETQAESDSLCKSHIG